MFHSAGQPAPQGDYCGPARAGFCRQGLKGRYRDHAPDTPISFLPNNVFVAQMCALLGRNEILTRDGVKVADVAWASDSFIGKYGFKTPYTVAPELCVEILSPGNSVKEIEDKVGLYLERGAHEVWIVDQKGRITYSDNSGHILASKIIKGVKL